MFAQAFNRTILELKLQIVRAAGDPYHAFNRTILELKPTKSFSAFSLTLAAFNRTILELKRQIVTITLDLTQVTFNRTILELKRYPELLNCPPQQPLIAPYWN